MQEKDNSTKSISNIVLCFALAILLALSLTLSFTGAWFTDSAGTTASEVSLRFGTVSLGTVSVPATVNNIYPGQTIAYNNGTADTAISYTGNVDAYYRVSFDVANVENGTLDSATLTAIKDNLAFTSAQVSSDGKIYGKFVVGGNSPATTIPAGTIKFSDSATNVFQGGKSFELTLKIDVIQAANLTETQVTGISNIGSATGSSLQTIYQNIFTYYDSL